MLQNAPGKTNVPPVFTAATRTRASRKAGQRSPMALDVIRADIAPLQDEADLLDALCNMAEKDETMGMVALFDGFVEVLNICQGIENQPRSKGFAEQYMEAESLRAWSKAYMVADFLKDQPISLCHRDEVGRVLVTAALMMGHGMKIAAQIATEYADLPEGFRRPPEHRSQLGSGT